MNLALLPDIFALAVFILAFRPLVRRAGSQGDIWFVGWTFLLIHSTAVALQTPGGTNQTVAEFVSIWAVQLCGLCFLYVSANAPGSGTDLLLALEISVPILLQSAMYVLHCPWHWLSYAGCGLYLAPGIDMLLSPKRRGPAAIKVSGLFAVFALSTVAFAWRQPAMLTYGSLSLLFLSSAWLYSSGAKRFTRGLVAAVTGLVAWALTYPAVALLKRYYPEIQPQHTLLALPQYLLAAGMLLSMLEEHVRRTERMAMHDPLTDLPNRRLFEERLIATMEEARINRTTVACLVIDVDNFKMINDTLGHTAGDQLLRSLAARLSWHMSPRDILARTGGDEFTALLAGVNDEHHLRFIAGAMMSAASVPIVLDGKPVDVRISVGIALSPDDADDIDSLRRAADEAMYSAKRRGGSLLAFAGKV